jgi:hypothetical protein
LDLFCSLGNLDNYRGGGGEGGDLGGGRRAVKIPEFIPKVSPSFLVYRNQNKLPFGLILVDPVQPSLPPSPTFPVLSLSSSCPLPVPFLVRALKSVMPGPCLLLLTTLKAWGWASLSREGHTDLVDSLTALMKILLDGVKGISQWWSHWLRRSWV